VAANVTAFWGDVSEFLGECTEGHVYFVPGKAPRNADNGNVWETIELPKLLANPATEDISVVDQYGNPHVIWKKGSPKITFTPTGCNESELRKTNPTDQAKLCLAWRKYAQCGVPEYPKPPAPQIAVTRPMCGWD
jgi:hypothetical protein